MIEHARIVDAELQAIAARIAEIDALLKRPALPLFGPVVFVDDQRLDGASSERRELESERLMLRRLAAEMESEVDPISRDRNGRTLQERDYAIVRMRAREIAENCREAAERHAAAGEHREAMRSRIDALQARRVAEYELRWRLFLPGYSHAW